MATIDHSFLAVNSGSIKEVAGPPPNNQKQAWLYALEKSMANTALMETQLFELSSKYPDASSREKADTTFTNKSSDKYEHLNQVRNIKEMQSSGQQIRPADLPIDSYPVSQKTFVPIFAGNGLKNVISHKVLDTTKVAVPISLVFETAKYAKQNIVLLNSNVGAELWIRDASMPRHKLMNMIKDFKSNMGELGASLVKVVLNGTEVFNQVNLAE